MAKEKTALIFGISGQDGAHLSRILVREGYKVHGSSRDAATNTFSNLKSFELEDKITFHSCDPTDFQSVARTISKSAPDEIYNLSGQSSVGLSFEQPTATIESITIATLNILEAIRLLDGKIRFFNAASSECFGNTPATGATISTPFNPKSPYAVAKAAAFWEVSGYRDSYGIYACSGVLFNHESPLRHERYVTRKITKAVANISNGKQDKLFLGNIDIHRDWGWAPEYMIAAQLILQRETPNDVVIATGESHSLREFVSMAFSVVGLNWEKYVKTDESFIRPNEITFSMGNPSQAMDLLDWKAEKKLSDVIAEMVEADISMIENK